MPENIRSVRLTGFTTVAVYGTDRVAFLQGQLTQDVERANPQFSPLTGWANAKGRLLAVGPLLAWRDGLHLIVPMESAAAIARRLQMFVLRAEARIETGLVTLRGVWREAAETSRWPEHPGAIARYDTGCLVRCHTDPTRAWLVADDHVSDDMDGDGDRAWRHADVLTGMPGVNAATSELFVPQMLNLDLLDGISFSKGCYVGQEIVARTQNLGRIKRRMFRFCAAGDSGPAAGELIHAESGRTGRVVSAEPAGQQTDILAVVPIADRDAAWFADAERTAPLARRDLPYEV